jgi:Fe2+ or Zn2+ uptake regulation protein
MRRSTDLDELRPEYDFHALTLVRKGPGRQRGSTDGVPGIVLETQAPRRKVALDEFKAYEERALKELRSAGYRVTMPRVLVIRALADTKRALSAYAIHEKIISSDGQIDVVSVYRILSTLQELGLIYHIGVVDGYFPCTMQDCGKRSEVVVFEGSGEVMELPLPDSMVQTIGEQAEKNGFTAKSIKIEITGVSTKPTIRTGNSKSPGSITKRA